MNNENNLNIQNQSNQYNGLNQSYPNMNNNFNGANGIGNSNNQQSIGNLSNNGYTNNQVNNSNSGFGTNSNSNQTKNNNYKIIIIVIVVVLIALFLIFGLKKNFSGNTGNGYTVNMQQTLNVKEIGQDYNFNFSVKVDSIEKNIVIGDEKYTRLKFTVTNNDNSDLSMGFWVNFNLLDSKGNKLDSSNQALSTTYLIFSDLDDSILLDSEYSPKQTKDGYLYFETDSEDIDKLEIRIVPYAFSEKGIESYYINLK